MRRDSLSRENRIRETSYHFGIWTGAYQRPTGATR